MVSDPESAYWDLMETVDAKAKKVIELIEKEKDALPFANIYLDEAIEILKNITQ